MSASRAVALVDRTSSSSASSRSWKGGAAGTGGGVGVGGQQVVKKQRAPNAKVKTGCQNCKIRRVKCDEGKPGCDKCFRYGIVCSGYPAPARIYQATSRLLVPKAQDLAPVPASSPPDLMVPVQQAGYLPTRHIHSGPNLDNVESRYFRFYVEDIAKQIAGPCGFGLWNVVIPQASDVQPFIGHAIVALGALSRSRIETNALKQFHHREYALAKHVEALAGMRQELQRDGYDSRIALIACLLVFCFESLQGNQAAASVHAAGGVSLLERWNRERNLKGSIEPSGSVLEDDGLYYAVACLDFQAMAFVDQRPLEYHQKMSAEIDAYLLTMPSSLDSRGQFKSLAAARHYGHKVMRKTFHFIYSAGIFFEAHQKNDFHSPGGDTDDSGSLSPDIKPLERFQIPQAMKDEQDFHMEGIRHWQVAATSVLKDSIRDPDSEECLLATLMQVHCTMTVITLAGCLFVDQSGYDDHIKDFEEILSLATSVWTRVTTKLGQFTFETGILPGLLEVGMHCRDRKIRKQTIDMLYTGTGYREGVWDSLAVANICNWVRNIEEEWMDDDGNIPSEMRATLTSINMLYQERRARVSVSQRTAPGEALREKEVTIVW